MKGGKRNDIDLGQHSLFAYSHFFLCLSEEFLPINLSNFYPNLASISQGTWSGTAQFSSVTQSYPTLQHHGLQYARLTSPSPTPIACSKSCPLSWWCHQTISSSAIPFSSCLQYFQASGSLPMSQFFISGGHSIGVSASVPCRKSGLTSFSIDSGLPFFTPGYLLRDQTLVSCISCIGRQILYPEPSGKPLADFIF